MKTSIAVILLGGLLCSEVIAAGRVTPPNKREQLLERATVALEATPQSFSEMPNGRNNPFAPMPRERVAPVVREEPKEVAVVARRLSDDRVLVAVSDNFQVSGSVIAGDRKLLRLRNGTTMREGSTFTARIQGERYEITVSEITPDGYALSHGDATIRRRFLETSSTAGSVTPAAAGEPAAE